MTSSLHLPFHSANSVKQRTTTVRSPSTHLGVEFSRIMPNSHFRPSPSRSWSFGLIFPAARVSTQADSKQRLVGPTLLLRSAKSSDLTSAGRNWLLRYHYREHSDLRITVDKLLGARIDGSSGTGKEIDDYEMSFKKTELRQAGVRAHASDLSISVHGHYLGHQADTKRFSVQSSLVTRDCFRLKDLVVTALSCGGVSVHLV